MPPAIIFSGKEAAFKSWFPHTGDFLDFRDVELTITGDDAFEVRSVRTDLSRIRGRYALCGELVVTAATTSR